MIRLLRLVRPYLAPLLLSVVLMAAVGAAQGMMALLIGPIFDRVLKPETPDSPVLLFTIPLFNHKVYLEQFVPSSIHNVWTMVALAILGVFLVKGLCDYFGNYFVNLVGLSAVTDLRQKVFDRVLRQDAHFFESNSTGRVMSSIMNDLEKIQVATSHMLADWLRQSFSAIFLVCVVLQKDWLLAVASLTVLPFVLVPTLRIGRRIRRTTRRAQDDTAELNQILQETISGHQVVKSFGTEDLESNRFLIAANRLKSTNLRYVALQALSSPLIEFFAAITIVILLTYARTADQESRVDAGGIHHLRHGAADAVRTRQAPHRHPQHFPAGAGRIAEGVRVPGSRSADRGKAGRVETAEVPARNSAGRYQLPLFQRSERIPFARRQTGSARGRSSSAGWPERRGQDHARESGSALLRRVVRRRADRRKRRSRPAACVAAGKDRDGGAGDVSF